MIAGLAHHHAIASAVADSTWLKTQVLPRALQALRTALEVQGFDNWAQTQGVCTAISGQRWDISLSAQYRDPTTGKDLQAEVEVQVGYLASTGVDTRMVFRVWGQRTLDPREGYKREPLHAVTHGASPTLKDLAGSWLSQESAVQALMNFWMSDGASLPAELAHGVATVSVETTAKNLVQLHLQELSF